MPYRSYFPILGESYRGLYGFMTGRWTMDGGNGYCIFSRWSG